MSRTLFTAGVQTNDADAFRYHLETYAPQAAQRYGAACIGTGIEHTGDRLEVWGEFDGQAYDGIVFYLFNLCRATFAYAEIVVDIETQAQGYTEVYTVFEMKGQAE